MNLYCYIVTGFSGDNGSLEWSVHCEIPMSIYLNDLIVSRVKGPVFLSSKVLPICIPTQKTEV